MAALSHSQKALSTIILLFNHKITLFRSRRAPDMSGYQQRYQMPAKPQSGTISCLFPLVAGAPEIDN
jgi:hypothetical protein